MKHGRDYCLDLRAAKPKTNSKLLHGTLSGP